MAEVMTLRDADALGRSHGESLALEVIGAGVQHEGVTLAYDEALEAGIAAGELANTFYDVLAESADGFRQYSPFEFYAAAINRRRDSVSGWAAYDAGFERGVRVALRAAGLAVLI